MLLSTNVILLLAISNIFVWYCEEVISYGSHGCNRSANLRSVVTTYSLIHYVYNFYSSIFISSMPFLYHNNCCQRVQSDCLSNNFITFQYDAVQSRKGIFYTGIRLIESHMENCRMLKVSKIMHTFLLLSYR